MTALIKNTAFRACWLVVLCLVRLEALAPSVARDAFKSILPTDNDTRATTQSPPLSQERSSRRDFLVASFIGSVALGGGSTPVWAVADCFEDCFKNCKKVAPKDPEYCIQNCKEYCAQEDRADGLSGSVSADNGEVGILGGSFGQGTVPKGEDKVSSVLQVNDVAEFG